MKILNYGSLNIDMVYNVGHFVTAGETIACNSFYKAVGGKGLNQSIALSRAGAEVYHAGKIGTDGMFLLTYLKESGVDTRFIVVSDTPSGNALIQVDEKGQNSIIVYGGANNTQLHNEIDDALSFFEENDYLILQNEINSLEYIVNKASEKKLNIVLNPSPIRGNLTQDLLSKISWFIMNEIEGKEITGESEPQAILSAMERLYPNSSVVLTLGALGAVCIHNGQFYCCKAHKVEVVDTTAAGDTFTGYFFASLIANGDIQAALSLASKASAITVSRNGAATSIPDIKEVLLSMSNAC